MTEAKLVQQAGQGDQAAWERLVRQHQEAVFRLAYLLLGDSDEAGDAAQETFIRAYRSLDRFDPGRPLRPWLLRIAANLARNRRRAISRYLAAVERLVRAAPPPPAPPPAAETVRGEEARLVWQAIRRLDRKDQEVIYLRYFLELSVAETAEVIGAAEGTVKSRLSRALDRLKQVIEQEFPDWWKEAVA